MPGLSVPGIGERDTHSPLRKSHGSWLQPGAQGAAKRPFPIKPGNLKNGHSSLCQKVIKSLSIREGTTPVGGTTLNSLRHKQVGHGEVQEVTWATLTWAPAAGVERRAPPMIRGFLLGEESQRALQDQAPAANSGLWFIWVTPAPFLASLVLGELIPYLSLSLGSHQSFVSPAFVVRQKK